MQIFITGIPTAGKTYLAKKLAKEANAIHVELDDLREGLINDPHYHQFVSFYYDKDEKEYYTNTSAEQKWADLVWQSEGLWPVFREEILKYANSNNDEARPVVFEAVNLLPHLVHEIIEKNFPHATVVVLVGESKDQVRKRIEEDNRWGHTPELWDIEANNFWNVERPNYIAEAEKFGYKVFESGERAFKYLRGLMDR